MLIYCLSVFRSLILVDIYDIERNFHTETIEITDYIFIKKPTSGRLSDTSINAFRPEVFPPLALPNPQ